MNLYEKLNRLDDSLTESKRIVKKKKLTEGIWAYQTYVEKQPGEKQPSKSLRYGNHFIMSRSPYRRERFGSDWKHHIDKIIEWCQENNPGLIRETHDFRFDNFGKNLNTPEAFIDAIEHGISTGKYELTLTESYSYDEMTEFMSWIQDYRNGALWNDFTAEFDSEQDPDISVVLTWLENFDEDAYYDFVGDNDNDEMLTERYRVDPKISEFNVGDRVAERYNDSEFNVGTIVEIKKDADGIQYFVKWDYSDREAEEWLYGDVLSLWVEDETEDAYDDDIDEMLTEYLDADSDDKVLTHDNSNNPFANNIDRDILKDIDTAKPELITNNFIKCSKSVVPNALYYVEQGEDVEFVLGNIELPQKKITHCWITHNGEILQTRVPDENVKLITKFMVKLTPNDVEKSKKQIRDLILSI